MLPLDREAVALALDTIGDRGRAASEATLLRWIEEHPTAPCERCSGRGMYAERAGVRRPFAPESFSAEAGDRYVSSCPDCRGFGKIHVTKARAAYLAVRKLREARKAYARLRSAVCGEHGLGAERFDRLTRKRLPEGKSAPQDWLEAARAVAAFFGVEVDRAA